MEDKKFQGHCNPQSSENTKRSWRDVLYDKEGFEEMERILEEIDYLVDLQEAPFRLKFRP